MNEILKKSWCRALTAFPWDIPGLKAQADQATFLGDDQDGFAANARWLVERVTTGRDPDVGRPERWWCPVLCGHQEAQQARLGFVSVEPSERLSDQGARPAVDEMLAKMSRSVLFETGDKVRAATLILPCQAGGDSFNLSAFISALAYELDLRVPPEYAATASFNGDAFAPVEAGTIFDSKVTLAAQSGIKVLLVHEKQQGLAPARGVDFIRVPADLNRAAERVVRTLWA